MKKLNQGMNTTLARTDLNPTSKSLCVIRNCSDFLTIKQQQQDQFLPPLPKAFPSTHESEPLLPYQGPRKGRGLGRAIALPLFRKL